MATAVSRINKMICNDMVMVSGRILLESMAEFSIRVMIRCPAVRLAVRRTDRVIGRIALLVVSIMIMKGIRKAGDLGGTRWASI